MTPKQSQSERRLFRRAESFPECTAVGAVSTSGADTATVVGKKRLNNKYIVDI
jgi:hypothetical protein